MYRNRWVTMDHGHSRWSLNLLPRRRPRLNGLLGGICIGCSSETMTAQNYVCQLLRLTGVFGTPPMVRIWCRVYGILVIKCHQVQIRDQELYEVSDPSYTSQDTRQALGTLFMTATLMWLKGLCASSTSREDQRRALSSGTYR